MTIASWLLFLYGLECYSVLGSVNNSLFSADGEKKAEMDLDGWRQQRQMLPDQRTGKVRMVTNTELPVDIQSVASWDVSGDDEAEDSGEFKLTTEKLAYILIGSCCVFSIICLCIVVVVLKYKKRREKKKAIDSECYFYPTAKCYRIRSYSDAHFYQVPIYYKDSSYLSSPPYVYYRKHPYAYYQPRNERKHLIKADKEKPSGFNGTKASSKFRRKAWNSSTLHEQTLDIRGRKTVKRITVLPPTKSDDWKSKSSQQNTGLSRSKKSFAGNTFTDSERHAWLNCIYLLDQLHKCHANTPNSQSANISTLGHS